MHKAGEYFDVCSISYEGACCCVGVYFSHLPIVVVLDPGNFMVWSIPFFVQAFFFFFYDFLFQKSSSF